VQCLGGSLVVMFVQVISLGAALAGRGLNAIDAPVLHYRVATCQGPVRSEKMELAFARKIAIGMRASVRTGKAGVQPCRRACLKR
jgi:hypothetical protein